MKNYIQYLTLGMAVIASSSFAQEKKKTKHLWELLGDAMSQITPWGTGSIRKDFTSGAAGNKDQPYMGTTHVTLFSPAYVAAWLLDISVYPITTSFDASTDSSPQTNVEKVIEEGEDLLLQLKQKRSAQVVGPHLKKALLETRSNLEMQLSTLALISGKSIEESRKFSTGTVTQISDYELTEYLVERLDSVL